MNKKIEIEYEGKTAIVELKELDFGEKNQLEEESTDIKIIGGQPIVKISTSKMKELALLKSIVDAPFTISLESIKKLSDANGKKLFEAYSELNNVSA